MHQNHYKLRALTFSTHSFQVFLKQISIMKVFILASLLVVAVSSTLLEQHEQFRAFKLEYGKAYINQVEEATRFAIFKDNILKIEEHNALYSKGLVSYKQAVNQFTDMSPEEFKAMLNLKQKPVFNNFKNYTKKGVNIPSSVDWRSTQVTSVKNQGSCGSCWAFSVSGSTEAAYYRKSGQLISLSPQQLVDCATDYSYGCDGGALDQTFPYLESKGIQSDSSYPYTAKQGSCKYDSSSVVTKVSDYVSIRKDEDALLEAVASVGPVSVAMDADYLSAYSSGIFYNKNCNPSGLNHGVLVVGYGSESGVNYWIVKNTWGASWGENGYFRIVRGYNHCGIAEDNVYPEIN